MQKRQTELMMIYGCTLGKGLLMLFIMACALCAWPLVGAETLESGLVGYLAFDGDLRMVTPGGEETVANFTRSSRAFTDDLRPLDEHVPRMVAGRFGEGVWLEPGYEGASTPECRNWLDPATAEILPAGANGLTAYSPVGDARLKLLVQKKAATDDGVCEVLEGAYALRIACAAPASGAASGVVRVPEGRYFLSLYVRSEGVSAPEEMIRLEAFDTTNAVLGSADVTVSADWSRVALSFDAGPFVRSVKDQKLRDVRFRVLGTRPGQAFVVDAVMLEMAGGFSYAGMGQASSWLPGNARRAPEMLRIDTLRHVLDGGVGSVAFWAQTRGEKQGWRTLFEIASGNRWEPFLQLRLQQGRLMMGPRTNAPAVVTAAVSVEPGAWHHYAVTWGDGAATMYFDGESVGEVIGLRPPTETASYRLGSMGPGTPANAVVDETVFYRRRLGTDEVMALAARTTPLGDKITSPVTIRPEHFLGTIAHGTEAQPWRCTIFNRGTSTIFGFEVIFQIGDGLRVSRQVRWLRPGKSADIEFRFLADLTLGHYPLRVTVAKGGRTLATFVRNVEITPAPTPFQNLQVSPWGFNSASEYGMTFGGGDVEDAMRKGLHWNPRQNYLGYPRTVEGEDLIQDMKGNPRQARFASPYMAAQVAREADRMAHRFAGIPAMRGIILNSEMQWIWTHDFTPENVDWVQRTFGLDLDSWRNPPKENENYHQAPYGRLLPAVGGYSLPSNRIVRVDDPLYAYHRWFHGPQAPTETYLNQTLGSAIQAQRPDILTIQEPILRRPSVRAFDRMSIAQEWFYYENPMAAVSVQERLNAAVRGTSLRISGMPQFLFKAGTAAPFNAMPTADMFHETAWLCVLQPIRMMTYWNFGPVPDLTYSDAYNQLVTKAELDALFGSATPTWKQVQDVLAAQPVAKLMTWTPELIATFKRFHVEEVGPLGGLIPEWQNRPRRLAILRSFANELYGGVRWPTFTRLENGVVYSGVPFDVLYDEDFEGGEDALASYQMVIVSQTVCLTQPTFDALQSFIKRGGVVAVDAGTRVEIPGALQIELADGQEDFAAVLATKEAELRKQALSVQDPAYVEAVAHQADAGDWPNHTEPALMQALEAHVQPEARSLTPNTWMNLLTAEDANYIGVVNDLRVSGPMFGHFGKVRETGVPLIATVVYESTLGAVAYDLLASRQVETSQVEGQNALRLELPPGGARLVMLLPRPIGQLSANANIVSAHWGDHSGREIQLEATLRDVDGQVLPGLVPATVTLLAPDGTRSDFSHHTIFRRGRLTCQFPVLSNGQTGTWRIRVQERASGQEAVVAISVEMVK